MLEKLLRWLNENIVLVLSGLMLLRIGFLFGNGLGLIGDESYYWDWSRQPDWCYYSKPPMVAWLIGLSTWLFGDNTVAVRLPAVVLGTVFLAYFQALAQACYGKRAAAFALLLMLATPDNVVANLVMTIDPPLYCFWIISLYYLHKALFQRQTRAWLWAGCAAGLALLSKQVAIALPIMLLLFIGLDRQRYHYLKREFWLYLTPIILALLPILIWNHLHDWIMFAHSKSHFTGKPAGAGTSIWKYTRDFFVYQILLISPLIFGLVIAVSLKNLTAYRHLAAQEQFLTLMGPVLLLGVLVLSFIQKVQGNWPMPFYFSALILLAGYWQQGHRQKLFHYALLSAYLMVAATYLLPGILAAFDLQNTKLDPTKRFKYWPQLAENVQQARLAVPGLEQRFMVVVGHRNLASELAFYLPDHPKMYRYGNDGAMSQYDLWPGPQQFNGANGMILSYGLKQVPEPVNTAFGHVRFIAEIANPKNPQMPYYLFWGENLQHWPVAAGGEANQEE